MALNQNGKIMGWGRARASSNEEQTPGANTMLTN